MNKALYMESNWYARIEEYNLGLMSVEQAAQFEAAMQIDDELAAAVRAHRMEWEMQELFAENVLRAEIRQRFLESPPEPDISPKNRNWLIKYWKFILPALLLLVGAGFFIFKYTPVPIEILPQNTPSPIDPAPNTSPLKEPIAQQPLPNPRAADSRRLALAAYRVPDGLSGVRGTADDSDTLTLAGKAFAQKNYRRTQLLLSKLPESDQQECLSLRAHAHFGAGDFQAAARDFSDLEKGGIYRREAQWYGLLASMATLGGDKKIWFKQLDSIRQQPNHPYRREAERLWQNAQ
ncbi:MAG: hypothetical protein ACKVT2_00265 [Saprospiraceae bacterium]